MRIDICTCTSHDILGYVFMVLFSIIGWLALDCFNEISSDVNFDVFLSVIGFALEYKLSLLDDRNLKSL